ncbi:MAG: hypothetical protein IPG45_32440 [Deltaproteobacteria bacterium]|jgi:hypothetical protein|nr:hypothetical protein [Deltaproteobacteria bacterium]
MKSLCLFLLLIPNLSAAAEPTPPPPVAEVTYAKKTLLDFSDLQVTAKTTRPAGDFLTVRRRARFRSLIRLRNSFQSELEVSAEKL